jgi:hypothetical protein
VNGTVMIKDKLERIWGTNLCGIMEIYPIICLEVLRKNYLKRPTSILGSCRDSNQIYPYYVSIILTLHHTIQVSIRV